MSVKILGSLSLVAIASFGVTFYFLNGRAPELPSKHFNGSQFVQEKLTNITLPYTIDLILRSKSKLTSTKYTDNTPPMPYLSGPLSIYQIGDKLRFHNGEKNVATVKAKPQWNRVTFTLDKKRQGRLYFNGKSVWKGPVNKGFQTLLIGKGHKKRYWTGDIHRFRISQGLLYSSDFDAKENAILQDMTVLYELK